MARSLAFAVSFALLAWMLAVLLPFSGVGRTPADLAGVAQEVPAGRHWLEAEIRELFPSASGRLDVPCDFRKAQRTVEGMAVSGMEPVVSYPAQSALAPGEPPKALSPLDKAASSTGSGSRPFGVQFPLRYTEPFVVEGDGVRVAVRPLEARPATLETAGGKAVYTGPYPLTDALYAFSGGRAEEFLLLRSPEAPAVFSYEVEETAGAEKVFLHDGEVRFQDALGRGLVALRPWILDAGGQRQEDRASWSLGPPDGTGRRLLTLTLDTKGLAFPLLVDPSWTTVNSMAYERDNHTATLLSNGKILVAGGHNGTLSITYCELYNPANGLWAPTGSMNTGRESHTATLLLNGKVLVAGGYNAGVRNSCELYDPSTGDWTPTGSLTTARSYHTATLLQDGRVLVTGGYTGATHIASCEVYNPTTGLWTSAGSLSQGRYWHTATLLTNGDVLVAGGYYFDGTPHSVKSCELYTPSGGGAWSPTGDLATGRYHHTATLLPSGKVLAAGGVGAFTLTSCELYDPSAKSWSPTGSLIASRYDHTATLLPCGKVLAAAGYGADYLTSCELYDPAGNGGLGSWSTTASLTQRRYYHTGTLMPDGRVLVAGGLYWDGTTHRLSSCEVYDLDAAGWSSVNGMTGGRMDHTASLLPDGKLLVAGGDNGGALSTCELFDASYGTWAPTGGLNAARRRHRTTLLSTGKVLATGGENGGGLSSCELYDPGEGSWALTGSMADGRRDHTATLLSDGRVLVAGGQAPGGALASCELYDPATGLWASTGALLTARAGHTATLLQSGKVLVAGGDGGGPLASCELYDPASGSWSPANGLVTARESHTATLLPDGRVLVAGGTGASGALSSCELYNPSGGLWLTTGALSEARAGHGACVLPDGRVLAVGGEGSGYIAAAERYDRATGLWSLAGTLTVGRSRFSLSFLPDGRVLAAGGTNGSALTSCEAYDEGLGYLEAWRPTLSASTNPLPENQKLQLYGDGLLGLSEASGGGGHQNASTNYPLVQIRRLDNGAIRWLLSDSSVSWTDMAFRSAAYTSVSIGHALVTVFSNAVPSRSRVLLLDKDTDGDGIGDSVDNCPSLSNPLQQNVEVPGAVSVWRFDEGMGSTALDTFDGNNGSLQNGAAYGPGKINTALALDGTDDYADFGDPASGNLDIPAGASFTFMAWVYHTSASDADSTILSKCQSSDPHKGYSLFKSNHAGDPHDQMLGVRLNDGTDELLFYSTGSVGDGAWHHVAFTMDGGTSTLAVYIDGAASGSVTDPIVSAGLDNDQGLRIGGPTADGAYFPGRIDEAAVFNRALAQSEIQAIVTNGFGDRAGDACDCAPYDYTLWAIPTEARNFMITRTGPGNLTWAAPSFPGSQTIAYDVLRSLAPSDFSGAVCVVTDSGVCNGTDATEPGEGEVFYYLVRSENACGGNLGTRSDGTTRTGRSCP